MVKEDNKLETAVFANGCFWCTEAVFQRVKGVTHVVSGYSGGHTKNPTYRDVCSGETGHAECLKISFNPAEITFEELLDIFWVTHDPTQLNRQGNDVGTQYRSIIFYQNEIQKRKAESSKAQLESEKVFDAPIVTEIVPLKDFYPAEIEHHDYYNRHPLQPYCYYVARPKVGKLLSHFPSKVKADE